jgi:hypothetical protein
MSELDRVKQAMCDGEHTDGDLEWAVDEIERLTAEGRVMREYIYSQGLSDADIKLWITAASDRHTPPKTPRPHKPTGAPPGQPDEWGCDCECCEIVRESLENDGAMGSTY